MKKPANPENFLPLKPHWFHVMLSLAEQEQHGYGIMQEVLDRTEGKVRLWPATLYGTLKRLIDAELIEESEQRPRPRNWMTRDGGITGSPGWAGVFWQPKARGSKIWFA